MLERAEIEYYADVIAMASEMWLVTNPFDTRDSMIILLWNSATLDDPRQEGAPFPEFNPGRNDEEI